MDSPGTRPACGKGVSGPPLLISTPTPPAPNRKTGLCCVPSVSPGAFTDGDLTGPSTHLSCVQRRRAEGRWFGGIQGPVLRAYPFQHAPPFFSCPVLLGWVIAGGTPQDPSVPQSQAELWPCSSSILPFEGVFHTERGRAVTVPAEGLQEEAIHVTATRGTLYTDSF